MEIKRQQEPRGLIDAFEALSKAKGGWSVAVVAGLLTAFLLGAYAQRAGVPHAVLRPIVTFSQAGATQLLAMVRARPERLVIDIKHTDFQRLAYKREVALAQGVLVTGPDDFVPASIRHRDKTVRVTMRLKGDWTDHLDEDEKWSFRIRARGNDRLLAMKEFSLQHPKTRNYIYEWIYGQALRREEVLAPRYEFVRVVVNGRDWGVYALEEHFETHLVEASQRREGPILKFNEDALWDERLAFDQYAMAMTTGFQSMSASSIEAFKLNRIVQRPALYQQFLAAKDLLEAFRIGKLPTHQVFDVEQLARYFAISDVLGTSHATIWHNLRFYYNPVTSRLEPIGFDGDFSGEPIQRVLGVEPATPEDDLWAAFFRDPVFFQAYIKELERVSQPAYLDTLLAELKAGVQERLDILHAEFPKFVFEPDLLYRNQGFIRAVLRPTKRLLAYVRAISDGHVELELGNIQSFPLEALRVSSDGTEVARLEPAVLLPGKRPAQLVEYHTVRVTLPDELTKGDDLRSRMTLHYRILGSSQLEQVEIFPWPHFDEALIDRDVIRQPPNVRKFELLSVDEDRKRITIKPGSWVLDQPLIIPAGYTVLGSGGSQLRLSNAAMIVSYSPLAWIGDKERPMVVRSDDTTGQGVVVLNAKAPSVLRHVVFENLSPPKHGRWELTGAITFYESPVTIAQCQFRGSRAEDSLNIVRSAFTIEQTSFRDGSGDALDIDFSHGTITDSSFVHNGNDAVDVSGSVVELQGVTVDGAGDKGLSAGESSRLTAKNVTIKRAKIGAASKDSSLLTIEGDRIEDADFGLAVYQKKPEFGPGELQASHLVLARAATPYVVETNAQLVIDGRAIEANREGVKALLYDDSAK